jgi:hypothetical protein
MALTMPRVAVKESPIGDPRAHHRFSFLRVGTRQFDGNETAAFDSRNGDVAIDLDQVVPEMEAV